MIPRYINLIKLKHYDPVYLQSISGDINRLSDYYDHLDSEEDIDNMFILRLNRLYGYTNEYFLEVDNNWEDMIRSTK